MLRNIFHVDALGAALTALPIVLSGQGAATGSPRAVPSHALILGVPFISWSEAASLDYAGKNIVNPSVPASQGMVLEYWGQELAVLKSSELTLPGWVQQGGDSGSLAALKDYAARGIPVIVCLAITPIAQNAGPAAVATMAMTDTTVRDAFEHGGPSSGVLGLMVALDTLRRWGQVVGVEPLRESVFMACRVVVGYDDARNVVILHDPSFGPAWEVSYHDFDAMWSIWDHFYVATYPSNFAEVLAKRPPASPYPARTVGQQAAEDFVYGYALASVGRRSEAEARLKDGLAISGLPDGYRHLLLLELARIAEARRDPTTAIALYEQASVLLPEDQWPWLYLGRLYQHEAKTRGMLAEPGAWQKGDSLLHRATALCADPEARNAAWNSLPHDLVIMPGCEKPTLPQPLPHLAPGEISYELPGSGWKQDTGPWLGFLRVEIPGSRAQAISVLPRDVPNSLRGLPIERQVAEYFDMERHSPHDPPWTGFVEGSREIAHRRYPTLTAQKRVGTDASHPLIADVLFVVVFPEDFAARQRFYVIMWEDFHPPSEPGAGPKALDGFVSSLRIARAQHR